MEDILASIKRIIADDGAAVVPPRARRPLADATAPPVGVEPIDVLELTEPAPPAAQPVAPDNPSSAVPPVAPVRHATAPMAVSPVPEADPMPPLVSPDVAGASRESLDLLSALVVRGATPPETTLEGLVREMLRPMLKEWLDARLPEMVETLVAREIARITGKAG